MILPKFGKWIQKQTPHWQWDRCYIVRWWTPFCHLSKRYRSDLYHLELETDGKVEMFVWLKRWWRRR